MESSTKSLMNELENDLNDINNGELKKEDGRKDTKEPKKPITINNENPIVIVIEHSTSNRDERVAVDDDVLIYFDDTDNCTAVDNDDNIEEFNVCPIESLVETITEPEVIGNSECIEVIMVENADSMVKDDSVVQSTRESNEPFEISDGEDNINDIKISVYNQHDPYLNDAVINTYFRLIKNRSPEKVYVFDTFLFAKLLSNGYDSIRRWTKNVDIFSKEILLLPIHLNNHWILAFVDVSGDQNKIKFYDSFLSRQRNSIVMLEYCSKVLISYFKIEHMEKKGCVHKGRWQCYIQTNIPSQTNNYDCGVFVCSYAEYLSRNATFDFSQEHMLKFREQIFKDIENNTLTPLSSCV